MLELGMDKNMPKKNMPKQLKRAQKLIMGEIQARWKIERHEV